MPRLLIPTLVVFATTLFAWPGNNRSQLVSAVEAYQITELPFSASQPGLYQLAADLTYEPDSGAAIVVAADGVTIDMNGKTLSGKAGPATAAVGILANNRRRVTIRKGTISGFYFGVDVRRSATDLKHSRDHRIEEVTAQGNYYFGMRVEGTHSHVENCQILNTGGTTRPKHTIPIGIRLVGQNNVLRKTCIRNLQLKHFDDGRGEIVGVHFDDARSCLMEENTIIEVSSPAESQLATNDKKERTFAVWINGGQQKNTYLHVVKNRIAGFTVPVVFSPGSDGEATGNVIYATPHSSNDAKPIRGTTTGKVEGNVVKTETPVLDCQPTSP